jgi:hypothetical protein
MSRTSTLILLGILIILTPFSGFPMAIRTLLTVIFGACVSGIGLTLRASEARNQRQSMETPPTPAIISSIASEPTPSSGVSPV